MKRMRGRNHRSGGGGGGGTPIRHNNGQVPMNRNHVFDSSGPDMRLRGTAQQLYEKYLQLGRDATSSDDRVAAEGYFQHAEHYFRIVNAMAQAAQQHQASHQNGYNPNPQHVAGQPNGQSGGQAGGNFQGNQRRFADPEEEDADGNQRPPQREFQQREHQPRENQPPREFQPRDGNRERDQNRFQRDGQRDDRRDDRRDFRRDDRQAENRPNDDRQDEREQPVSRIVAHDLTQPAPEQAAPAPRASSRPVVQDLGETASAATLPFDAPPAAQAPAPAPVRTRTPRAEKVAVAPVEAPSEAAEPAAAPARAPRGRRPRVAAEQNGLGDQPEIKPAPSLTTVED